jgi:phospholipase C
MRTRLAQLRRLLRRPALRGTSPRRLVPRRATFLRTFRQNPAAVAGVVAALGLGLAAAALGLAAIPASAATSAADAHHVPTAAYLRAVGGTGRGRLSQPAGVAIARNGDVWAADSGRNQAAEFTPSGRLVTAFSGHGAGALADPLGIAVAGGHVWVADTGRDRIVEFTAAGAQLAVFGGPGSGPGQLDQPAAVAVARSGDLYVADEDNNRIEKFSQAGRYLAAFPAATPQGIAIDASGDVWVSSPSYADGNALYEFSPAGRLLRSVQRTQDSYGALSDPAGIAIGPDNRLYVAQPDFGWVTVLSRGGRFRGEFGPQPSTRKAAEDLSFPQDVAVSADGTIWVADTGNGRLVEFSASAAPGRSVVPLVIAACLAALLAAGAAFFARSRWQPPTAKAEAGTGTPAPAADVQAQAAAAVPGGLSRRRLLSEATLLAGAGIGASVLPFHLRRALAATLDRPPRPRLSDIEHVVILMQENRSFDHYYGTMPGVRGFADPTAIMLPSGRSVFYQPDPAHPQGYLVPFHYDTKTTSAQATPRLDHSWRTQHEAWAKGTMDAWIEAKGPHTMGYFRQEDIPFHWALAEAFTLCDNYHCSVLGPTDPNRCYMWTGMVDPRGLAGGPVTGDQPTFNDQTLSWTTYPERLQAAGISWRVYQEEDNYDNNALAWFRQYQNAPTSSPLQKFGMARQLAGTFESDARAGRLPQVSWLVAPTAQSEHPNYFPAAGAEYIAQKLDAIASNPDVWARTAFILTYDENDGQFDHVPPPVPPPGTPGEFIHGEPIGLGFRVPVTIVSPWTAGGHVYSEVLDHSSLIRFLEARFGVMEPNIGAWRRRTCGDMTGAFRQQAPTPYPRGDARLRLATTEARLLAAQQQVYANPAPAIPPVNKPLPAQ